MMLSGPAKIISTAMVMVCIWAVLWTSSELRKWSSSFRIWWWQWYDIPAGGSKWADWNCLRKENRRYLRLRDATKVPKNENWCQKWFKLIFLLSSKFLKNKEKLELRKMYLCFRIFLLSAQFSDDWCDDVLHLNHCSPQEIITLKWHVHDKNCIKDLKSVHVNFYWRELVKIWNSSFLRKRF